MKGVFLRDQSHHAQKTLSKKLEANLHELKVYSCQVKARLSESRHDTRLRSDASSSVGL